MDRPPPRMRAAYVTELGAAEAIAVGELPVPALGPVDVLVRVELAAVDPVDLLVRSGAYPTPTPFPFVVGRDLVGTVAVAGPGAAGFAPGDRVWCNSLGHGGRQGACAEYAVVAAERCYHLPAGADPVAAVALFHPAVTAWLALFRHGGLRPGETPPPPTWPRPRPPATGCWLPVPCRSGCTACGRWSGSPTPTGRWRRGCAAGSSCGSPTRPRER